jgi:hypothetical protein
MVNAGPVPPDEELLLALGNTGHEEVDELADADGVARWWAGLASGGTTTPALSGTPGGRAGRQGPDLLVALRDAVRDTAATNTDGGSPPDGAAGSRGDALVDGLTLHPVTSGGRLTLQARPGADLAEHIAAAVVAALLRSQARPAWPRLKACAAPDCRWLFVDASRNRSRRWCDMAECGNRAKSAAFRRRRRA